MKKNFWSTRRVKVYTAVITFIISGFVIPLITPWVEFYGDYFQPSTSSSRHTFHP